MPLKGFHHSEKAKKQMAKNNSKYWLGKHASPRTEFKKGHTSHWKGKHRSEKTKTKMSEKNKGQTPWNKGKKGQISPMKGKHLSEETKRKHQEARIRYMISGKAKNKETVIEKKIEAELKRRNIYYEKQIPLCKVTIVDFYLPETRTVIYCDGDYWHSLKGRKDNDINQDLILMFHGFNVYRFTEAEINKSAKRCINKILKERR